MKSILQLNNSLMNSIVEEEEFSNDISFSQNVLLTSKIDNNITLNCIKNIILNNDIEEDTTLEMIIDSVKKFQIKEKDDFLFNILKMRNNISLNSDNDKLHIDDNTKQKNYPLLSTHMYHLLRKYCRYCYMRLLNYLKVSKSLYIGYQTSSRKFIKSN